MNGVVGMILYFWVFEIGGLIVARLMGFSGNGRQTIIFCLALAGIYIAFQLGRYLRRRKKAKEEEAEMAAAAARRQHRAGSSGNRTAGPSQYGSKKKKKH